MMNRLLLALVCALALAGGARAQNLKTTQLTEATAATGDDITVVVDDPASAKVNKKITVTNLFTDRTLAGTTEVSGALKWLGDISPSQLTANTNDWNPTGLSTATVIRFSTDAARDITGLAGGADGRVIVLHNVGSQDGVLKDESGSSTAANRFAFSADVTLAGDQSVTLRYDATSSRWRITTPQGGGAAGATANATTGRYPYLSGAGVFSDAQIIRHSLYHTAWQDSTFTGANQRIFDWYYTAADNSATPGTYGRMRLENTTGNWTLSTQQTSGTPTLSFGTGTNGGNLLLKTAGTDEVYLDSTGFHANGDGGADLGKGNGSRWNNGYFLNSIEIGGMKFTTGGSHVVNVTSFGGNVSKMVFEHAAADQYIQVSQAPGVATCPGSGATTWNFHSGSLIKQTMGCNIATVTLSNPVADQILTVVLIQDATGSRTITWPAAFKFSGGTAPTLTTTAASRDIFTFWYDGTNYWERSRSMDVR